MVLADGLTDGEFCLGICVLDDYAILPVPSKLGTVDYRIRAIIHGHLECAALLFRHVLSLQWRKSGPFTRDNQLAAANVLCLGRPTVQLTPSVLAVLDVLRQSIDILDWRCSSGHLNWHPHRMYFS